MENVYVKGTIILKGIFYIKGLGDVHYIFGVKTEISVGLTSPQ